MLPAAVAMPPAISHAASIACSCSLLPVPENSENSPLQIGDRVRLSALGRERSPKMTKTGVTVGAIGSSFEVLMDGSKIPVRLHKTYLEKADA
jgi:hypothetical protein